MPLILPSNSISGGYEVANSLRFDDGSSDHLTKTASTPTNNKKQTSSVWVKRSALSGSSNFGIMGFVDSSSPSTSRHHLYFINDQLAGFYADPTITRLDLKTNRLFRDTSAWYHIVLAIDTTQGTASDRAKLYVNGVQETSFATSDYPVQDITFLDSGETLQVGRLTTSGGSQQYFDGYIAEAVFIDGQALDPTSFGEFDEDSGIWKPIDVSGLTFGTNGFYLDFENSGSLGADVSGNGNNFTVNNLTSIDQTTDTPTNNFATMNPLDNYYASSTFSEGNLKIVTNASNETFNTATIPMFSGKWYWEIKVTSGQPREFIGITDVVTTSSSGAYSDAPKSRSYYSSDGQSVTGSTGNGAYGDTYGTGDIMGVALDIDNGYLYFSKNGTFQNSGDPTSGATGTGGLSINSSPTNGYWLCQVGEIYTGSSTFEVNFGNPTFTISSGNSDANGYGNFEYAVPSGYYALNTKNLAEYG